MNKHQLKKALQLAGELWEDEDGAPLHLVICGGAALQATGVVDRKTGDIDIFAKRGEIDGEVMMAHPLPVDFQKIIERVAREQALPSNWLNAATSMLFVVPLEGLPKDFFNNIEGETFSSNFRVSYLGRTGLIYLKWLAAIQRDEERDLNDLRALSPTLKESEAVFAWLKDQEIFNAIAPEKIRNILSIIESHE